ncbi:TolC family protein [Marinigracilibium pacificum]|nr:TolC family protein [Marinigracilibium pacificum]
MAQTESEKVFTLKESIEYALSHSQDMRIADYEMENAENQIKEIRSTGLPQVNAYAKLEDNLKLPTQILPGELIGEPGGTVPVQFGVQYVATAGVQFNQLIFNKSYLIGLEAARTSKEYYALNKIKTEESVIYHVSANYYRTLYIQEQLKVVDQNLERLTQLLKIMEVRANNDLVRQVDLNRVKVSKTNLQTQKSNLVTQLEQQKNLLKYSMGMTTEDSITLDNKSIGSFDEQMVSSLQAINSNTRTEIKLLEKQKELNTLNDKNIKAGYYPSLSLYGGYNYVGQQNELGELFNNEWFDAAMIGIRLDIPIFDGFQKKYRSAQAKVNQSIIDENMSKTKTYISLEQETAQSTLKNSLENLEAQHENMLLAEKVYDQQNSLYKEGVIQLIDLLDAETALREAQTGYNTGLINVKLAELELIKANGNLNTLNQ